MIGSSRTVDVGRDGEHKAGAFFLSQGFEIVERNFRFGRSGEIDLIVRKGDFFIFVEVKTRSSSSFGGAVFSITAKKRTHLRKTAGNFINTRLDGGAGMTFRFDLLSICDGSIEWIEDIIR